MRLIVPLHTPQGGYNPGIHHCYTPQGGYTRVIHTVTHLREAIPGYTTIIHLREAIPWVYHHFTPQGGYNPGISQGV